MKGKLRGFIRGLVILAGLAILIYPSLSEYLAERNSSRATASYDDSVIRMEQERLETLREQAQEYNRRLAAENGQDAPQTDENGEPVSLVDYWELLDPGGNGMMGYITIPRINVTIPIYHGASEEILQVAVGHLQNTSLPVGGESTHAALSGHRGLPSRSLFTDLDQLEIGDVFYLKILNQTMCYTVDQIKTVLPNETQDLAITEGEDYVTLVTCTPYGVNSHRLLVRGTRTPYTPEEGEVTPEVVETSLWMRLPIQYRHLLIGLAVLVAILILRTLVGWVVKSVRKRRKP